MNGVYDYKGECFAYIEGDRLYNLEDDVHVGYVTDKALLNLQGEVMWHRQKDGLYDKHWVSIGYIGSARRRHHDE